MMRRRLGSDKSSHDEKAFNQSSHPILLINRPNNRFDSNNPIGTTVEIRSKSSADKSKDMMEFKDRTREFRGACKSMQLERNSQNTQMRNGQAVRMQKSHPHIAQTKEFNSYAKQIGKDLTNTYSKLQKLTSLAQRKSMFDDRPAEISDLTEMVNHDIRHLNKQIAQLQKVVKCGNYENSKNQKVHSNTVVVSLQSRLATMSNKFKQVLEVRTENLKKQKQRRSQFSNKDQAMSSRSLPPSASKGFHAGSVLLQDEQQAASYRSDFAINMDGITPNHQQMQMIEQDTAYIQDRASTMQNIESTIVELGSIFQQLATMVHEQEEMVQRIDSSTTDTLLNVEAAHGEILKYFQSISSDRWLMIKIFAVLIIFFIIFIVFLA